MQKTTIDVQFSQKMNFLFQNILTFYCLNEKKNKDVDEAETSYDLTITVKLLTVNRAHRLRKIPYTKSKFHSRWSVARAFAPPLLKSESFRP